jgi:hypothetical protein
LFSTNLKGHGRRVETDTDIDLPKLFKTDIVIGSEGSSAARPFGGRDSGSFGSMFGRW